MELTQIRYFLEVAESQHMTVSAEKLHIAQPALSQAIRRLEASLGVPLLKRKGRNIVLTQYGVYLRDKLIPIVDQLDQIPQALKIMAKLDCETIHLSVLAASTMITNAIIEYKNTRKALNFQLLQSTHSEVFDIEISTRPSSGDSLEGAKNQFICQEKIFLAVPANGAYRERTAVSLREVADEGFISLIGSRQFEYTCDKFFHRAGISPRVVFESHNPAAVKNMIAADLGIGFWPEFTWGKLDTDKIRLLEISDPVCSREIVITCHHNKTDNSNVMDFFEFLKGYCIRWRDGDG